MNRSGKERNCAFIDAQNLHMSIESMGWKLDYKLFHAYLQEHYNVRKAYMFMGFKPDEQSMYDALTEYGYDLVFKPAIVLKNGITKGNCDADLVLKAMIDYNKYDKAVIVSGDGDFHCLIQFLKERGKLGTVLAPSIDTCSGLIKNLVAEQLESVSELRGKLEYIKAIREVKKAPATVAAKTPARTSIKRTFGVGFVVRRMVGV